jgi:hypothetical protein
MFNTSRSLIRVGFALLFTPVAAFAQTNEDGSGGHKMADLLWGILPFIVLGILFWFFFIRTIRKQQSSPAVKRHQEYMARHEQHMERMEQLHERIAKALEKRGP